MPDETKVSEFAAWIVRGLIAWKFSSSFQSGVMWDVQAESNRIDVLPVVALSAASAMSEQSSSGMSEKSSSMTIAAQEESSTSSIEAFDCSLLSFQLE